MMIAFSYIVFCKINLSIIKFKLTYTTKYPPQGDYITIKIKNIKELSLKILANELDLYLKYFEATV
jgi:hypothetical protein